MEFHLLAKLGLGTLAPPGEDPGPFESEDNPLVSELVKPVTLPLRLFIPSLKERVNSQFSWTQGVPNA